MNNTGSIYYNLEKTNNSGSSNSEDVSFNLNTYEEILPNPMNWQVGINRFKLPVNDIDLFRIYPKRYYIGASTTSSQTLDGIDAIKPTRTNCVAKGLVDLFQYNCVSGIDLDYVELTNTTLTTNTTINGVVVPTNTSTSNETLRENGYYEKVNSHQKFVDILNRRALQSLVFTNKNSGADNSGFYITDSLPTTNIVAATANELFRKGNTITNFIKEDAGWTGINTMYNRWSDNGGGGVGTEHYFTIMGKGAANTGNAAGSANYPKQGGVDTSDMNVFCPVWFNMPIQQVTDTTNETFASCAIANQNFKSEGENGFMTLGVIEQWQFNCKDIVINKVFKNNVQQTYDPDISCIKFYLAHRRGASASHSDNSNWDRIDITPNWSGFKVSEFSSFYPNGFRVSSDGTVPLQMGQNYLIGGNLNAIKNGSQYIPNYCVDNAFDTQLFLGQSVNPKASSNSGARQFMLEIVVSGTEDESIEFLMRKNGFLDGQYLWQLNFETNCNPSYTADGLNNTTSYGSVRFPRFMYDPSTKAISHRHERFWFNRDYKIYMNKGLQGLLGFKFDNPIMTDSQFLKSFQTPFDEILRYANVSNITLCGEELTSSVINRLLGGYMNTNDADASQFFSGENNDGQLTTIEIEPSFYKRRFLYGISIISTSIPNTGEYIGSAVKRKVLTDFVIDPSTNGEDYLIYEPENGGERFYPLNTNLPLRDLVVSVLYTDMNLNTRQLTLASNYTTTMKIEFRPNNMLLNYQN